MKLMAKNNKFGKVLLIISALFFIWISSFGLMYHMNEMKLDSTKNSCLFSGSPEACAMTFSEHVTLWQGMTTTLPQNILGIMGTLLAMVTFALVFTFYRNYLFEFTRRISFRFRLYIKQHPQINLFNYLGEVFSSGILNTKKYKLATI